MNLLANIPGLKWLFGKKAENEIVEPCKIPLREQPRPQLEKTSELEEHITKIMAKRGINPDLCYQLMDRLLYITFDTMGHLELNKDITVPNASGGTTTIGKYLSTKDPKTLNDVIGTHATLLKMQIEQGVDAEHMLAKLANTASRNIKISEQSDTNNTLPVLRK